VRPSVEGPESVSLPFPSPQSKIPGDQASDGPFQGGHTGLPEEPPSLVVADLPGQLLQECCHFLVTQVALGSLFLRRLPAVGVEVLYSAERVVRREEGIVGDRPSLVLRFPLSGPGPMYPGSPLTGWEGWWWESIGSWMLDFSFIPVVITEASGAAVITCTVIRSQRHGGSVLPGLEGVQLPSVPLNQNIWAFLDGCTGSCRIPDRTDRNVTLRPHPIHSGPGGARKCTPPGRSPGVSPLLVFG